MRQPIPNLALSNTLRASTRAWLKTRPVLAQDNVGQGGEGRRSWPRERSTPTGPTRWPRRRNNGFERSPPRENVSGGKRARFNPLKLRGDLTALPQQIVVSLKARKEPVRDTKIAGQP
jgi:hypothetical protein